MKILKFLPFILLLDSCAYAQSNLPIVTTQLISNDTASSAFIQSQVNPNSTNVPSVTWFRWDVNPATMANVTTNVTLSATNVNVAQSFQLTGLLAGTRYYYQAVASNSVGVTWGTIDNFATTQVSYNYTAGQGLNALDPLRPYGSEPGSVWDDALRQVKAFLFDFTTGANGIFNVNGSLQNQIIQTANLQDGSVTAAKLSADAYAAISSNGVTGLTVTNGLLYDISSEYTGVFNNSFTNAWASFGSLLFASNSWRHALVTADLNLQNDTSANRLYYIRCIVLDPTAGTNSIYGTSGAWNVPANRNMPLSASWFIGAHATNNVTVFVQCQTDATKATASLSSIKAQVMTMRILDIP
jgi:hypothetical protein